MTINNSIFSTTLWLCRIIVLVVFVCLCYKAANMSMTHDESYTYTRYVGHDYWEILTYDIVPVEPNNHILNTLAIKLVTDLFGNYPLVVRMPNLLAFLLFGFMMIRWLQRYRNSWLLLGGLMLCIFNPYLLDFFCLARGYGLAIALMTCSMVCYFDHLQHNKRSLLIWAFVTGGLAVLANFTLLNYYLGLLGLVLLVSLQGLLKASDPSISHGKWQQQLKVSGLITLALGMILYEPIRKITGGNRVDELIGGTTGFWQDTVISLIKSSIYFETVNTALIHTLSLLTVGSLLLILIITLLEIIRFNGNIARSKAMGQVLLLLIPALSTIAQHHLLGSKYMHERTALFFLPVFTLAFVHCIYRITDIEWLRLLANGFILVLGLAAFGYTAWVSEPDYVRDWKYERHTEQMMLDLKANLGKVKSTTVIKLCPNWLFEPTINYYKGQMNYTWLAPVERHKSHYPEGYDYYFLFDTELENTTSLFQDTLQRYETPNTLLLR